MHAETFYTNKLRMCIKKTIPEAVYIKHKDDATSGVADFTVTWIGLTSWHEVKVAPGFESQLLQEITCRRLELHGLCDYIIYDEVSKDIVIASPKSLATWEQSVVRFPRFNHAAVAGYIKALHERYRVNQS